MPGRRKPTSQEVIMPRVRVHNFSVSLDGFGTGEGQTLDAPFGHAGTRLHEWFFPTRTFRAMQGQPGGSVGIDDAFASAWGPGIGAEIMGRGKFGPHHGPWPEEEWNGWWGDNPPFGTPVFVLTHHPRPSVQMKGGTTFHFLDASPAQALAQAREAAGGADVRIGGGPSTVRQFLAAGLIDYLHIVVVPIVLGRGERLWDGLEALEDHFQIEAASSPSGVTHVTFSRRLRTASPGRAATGRFSRPRPGGSSSSAVTLRRDLTCSAVRCGGRRAARRCTSCWSR
jgi:dihydrofolate reductase